ncbi:MAG: FAD-dependent monooxygenase [Opitutales bacterium]|nr:FAD-dependent monooxygenase [Opitutales bacterium]
MKTLSTDVLIAGAGPVGLLLALWLTRNGVRVVVVDCAASPGTHSYALGLHPETVTLLKECGLGPTLESHAPAHSEMLVYAEEEPVTRLPLAGKQEPLRVFGQHQLESVLETKLRSEGVEVLWCHALTDFCETPDGIEGIVDEREERLVGYASAHLDWFARRSLKINARFLVGADGHRSLTRRRLGLTFREIGKAEIFAVFEFVCRDEDTIPVLPTLVFHPKSISALWPTAQGNYRWAFEVDARFTRNVRREKDRYLAQWSNDAAFPAVEEGLLRDFIAKRAPWFTPKPKNILWRSVVRFERRIASEIGKGRVALVGDSAHLGGPLGMHSVNLGMQEARSLGDALTRWIRDDEASDILAYRENTLNRWQALLANQSQAGSAVYPAAIQPHANRLAWTLPVPDDRLAAVLRELAS